MKKRILSVVLCGLLFVGGCGSQGSEENENIPGGPEYEAAMEEAKTTPYGKYPELITYTLAKMSATNNSNMPEGDTYENNAYTRYLRELLNIQNEDVFEEKDDQYYITVDMAISSGEIPDIMVVKDAETVAELYEQGMIEDLTQVYENCASQVIKEIYASYGDRIFEPVTFDGKLMALPETSISDGPNLIWLRQDWLDKLGLEPPGTIEELENVVRAFITENPGGNAPGETVGIMCNTDLCGENGISLEYQLDILFAGFGAFPKQWIYDQAQEVCYGSVQPQAKEALSYIHRLYDEGIIDPNFLLRTDTNIVEMIVSGKCGAFFGPWWAPNNPLVDAVAADPEAEWQPYLIATAENGATYYHSQNPAYKYVVVRKGFAHPEIVPKMISVIFDYSRYEDVNNEELSAYFTQNVDPTARPVAINVDYNWALRRCYQTLMSAFGGKTSFEEMPLLERSYYTACKAYLEKGQEATAQEWAAYESRIEACSLLNSKNIIEVESLYFGETSTMRSLWWKLQELENQAYLKIVCGEEDISYFDTFVEEWMEMGGAQIVKEVAAEIKEDEG
ncbi:MAG: extracellular solute-binding protein [Lachnospiraceae bacterium]|nr:extracellular solute-binding protein [Lachnospiraceae bacterium]